MIDLKKSVLQKIDSSFLKERNIELFIKRDDLLHPEISGNKWRKLKFNIEKCMHQKNEGVLTFGGAFSNHLVATAAACELAGLKSIGIVRGDELNSQSNDTLRRCEQYGMQLKFVSRQEYGLKTDPFYQKQLLTENQNYYWVPEGGANYLGIVGCQEIVAEIDQEFDAIFVDQGTTTTSCGVAMKLNESQKLYVVPVLKGFDSIGEMRSLMLVGGISKETVDQILEQVVVCDKYHFGGFGKYNQELLEFIRDFYKEHNIKLGPIYTGKCMYALYDLIKSGEFDNQKIVFLHTGGIQGAQSVIDKTGFELYS